MSGTEADLIQHVGPRQHHRHGSAGAWPKTRNRRLTSWPSKADEAVPEPRPAKAHTPTRRFANHAHTQKAALHFFHRLMKISDTLCCNLH